MFNSSSNSNKNVRIAIIGTGFGGLGFAIRLKQAGFEQFTLFEKAADVGGVWRDNTYPGAACDVPSHLYSFSFEQELGWKIAMGHLKRFINIYATVRINMIFVRMFNLILKLPVLNLMHCKVYGIFKVRLVNSLKLSF